MMNLDIKDDIKKMISEDIVYTHEGFTIDSFFSYLGSVVKDAQSINNLKFVGELVNAQLMANTNVEITSDAIKTHLKLIKKSKFVMIRYCCPGYQS